MNQTHGTSTPFVLFQISGNPSSPVNLSDVRHVNALTLSSDDRQT